MHVKPAERAAEKVVYQDTGLSRKRKREHCPLMDQSHTEWWSTHSRRILENNQGEKIGRYDIRAVAGQGDLLSAPHQEHGALRAVANKVLNKSAQFLTADTVPWCVKYAPHSASAVLQAGSEAILLRDWLKTRRLHNKENLVFTTNKSQNRPAKHNAYNQYDDFIVDDSALQIPTSDIGAEFDDALERQYTSDRAFLFRSNLVILSGPTGCGKSAAILAVAEELDFEIFEVNSTERRSGRDIVEKVGEASQSQMVNKQKTADGTQSKSLILFEEVDVLYRDDKDFWQTVLALVATSKRPIVITCNDPTVLPVQLQRPDIIVDFKTAGFELTKSYLQALTTAEDCALKPEIIDQHIQSHKSDLRATINSLQFLCLCHTASGSRGAADWIQNLVSNEDLIASRYLENRNAALGRHRFGKRRLAEFRQFMDDLGFIDILGLQQHSVATEDFETFENDLEEQMARAPQKDDVIGQQMISEPLGRHTRLQPGDLDFTVCLAVNLQALLSDNLKTEFPVWRLPDSPDDWHLASLNAVTPQTTAQTLVQETQETWDDMTEACESFAMPENWMADYAPHNSIDRPRQSGILAAEVMPYLRHIARVEETREEAWDRVRMAPTHGRMTRNTMSNEFGVEFRRPLKIPVDVREDILATKFP